MGLTFDPADPIPLREALEIGRLSNCEPDGDMCADPVVPDLLDPVPIPGVAPCGPTFPTTSGGCDQDGDGEVDWRDMYAMVMKVDICRRNNEECQSLPILSDSEDPLAHLEAAGALCAALRAMYAAPCIPGGGSGPATACDFLSTYGDQIFVGANGPADKALLAMCPGLPILQCGTDRDRRR